MTTAAGSLKWFRRARRKSWMRLDARAPLLTRWLLNSGFQIISSKKQRNNPMVGIKKNARGR